MIWLVYILAYIIIPFIIFSINDWFAGYYHHKVNRNMSIYNDEDYWIPHTIWPIVVVILLITWIYNLNKNRIDNIKLSNKLSKIYDDGEARRKKLQDLDYQAEKYLLDKK